MSSYTISSTRTFEMYMLSQLYPATQVVLTFVIFLFFLEIFIIRLFLKYPDFVPRHVKLDKCGLTNFIPVVREIGLSHKDPRFLCQWHLKELSLAHFPLPLLSC